MVKVPRAMQFTTAATLVAALTITLALLVGGVLFGGVALMAQGQSFPARGVVITEDDRLNLRDVPSTDSEIIGKIEPETAVDVLGISDDGAWYEVSVPGIGTGWVSSEWVRIGDAPAEVVLVPTPTPGSSEPAAPRSGIAARIAAPAATREATATTEATTQATAEATAEAASAATAPARLLRVSAPRTTRALRSPPNSRAIRARRTPARSAPACNCGWTISRSS